MSRITMTDDAASDPSFAFQGHRLTVTRGHPLPLGAHATPDGVNFVLLCRHGTAVTLVLSEPCNAEIAAEIPLDPRNQPHRRPLAHPGRRPARRVLLRLSRRRARGGRAPVRPEHRPARPGGAGALVRPASGALPGDLPRRSLVNTAMAERPRRHQPVHPARRLDHLRAARPRLHLSSRPPACAHPGTFAGLVEKIPYLKELGVTAVELLPIHEFDENDCPFVNPLTGEQLRTSGATTASPSPPPRRPTPPPASEHGQVDEFREMVRAFHAAGIEVILDVVFNHTGEGDDRGRTYSFRGLDNELYYLLDDRRQLPELLRLRQHGQLQPPGRPRPDPDLPALLGRPTCTSTACASTWPRSSAATAAATSWSSRRSSR